MTPPIIARNNCQVLRFDLPKLTPKDCVSALDFKLKAAYPGYRDGLQYYTCWTVSKKGLSVIVLIIKPNSSSKDEIPEKEVIPGFPLFMPERLESDCLLTTINPEGYEIHIYKNRSLSQSHFMPLEGPNFVPLVASLRTKHPELTWYEVNHGLQSPWKGQDMPTSLTSEELIHPKYCPSMELKGVLKKSWGPILIRGALSFFLLGLFSYLTFLSGLQFQSDRESLENEIAGYENQSNYFDLTPDQKKILQKKLEVLKEYSGYPIPAIFHRLAFHVNGNFILTSFYFKAGILRIEGQGINAVSILEELSKDAWFKEMAPLTIRKDPTLNKETFVFEGRVSYD